MMSVEKYIRDPNYLDDVSGEVYTRPYLSMTSVESVYEILPVYDVDGEVCRPYLSMMSMDRYVQDPTIYDIGRAV